MLISQLTSQDKTAQVIQRALEKHHLEHVSWQDFTLTQVISQERGQDAVIAVTSCLMSVTKKTLFKCFFFLSSELLIPDKANVFYAMSTTANFDFVLRQYHKGQKKALRPTSSLGRFTQ